MPVGLASDLLLDTDVCVDHLRGARALSVAGEIAYSVVTRCELYAGRTNEAPVDGFLAAFHEIPVDRAIAERAGRLRRDAGIAMADALIAATALEHHLDLVTRNRRHFARVPGLRVLDPSRSRHT